MGSDFARYTIPSEIENYGISAADMGQMIFEDILKSGYLRYVDYDKEIVEGDG